MAFDIGDTIELEFERVYVGKGIFCLEIFTAGSGLPEVEFLELNQRCT
jgi:hypothetical protein